MTIYQLFYVGSNWEPQGFYVSITQISIVNGKLGKNMRAGVRSI